MTDFSRRADLGGQEEEKDIRKRDEKNEREREGSSAAEKGEREEMRGE